MSLIAWRLYLQFITKSVTWSGFAAGLVLALAFFCDFTAIAYVIPFAIAAPKALFRNSRVNDDQRLKAVITGFLVIAMPAVFALIAWCYVTWITQGSPFAFVTRPGQEGIGASQATWIAGTQDLLATVGDDLARVPLYVLVAILLINSGRILLAYVFPVLLSAFERLAAFPTSEAFTLGTYLAFAMVGLVAVFRREPQRLRTRFSGWSRTFLITFIALAAVAQLLANLRYDLRSPEPLAWRDAVLNGHIMPEARDLERFGKLLSSEPSRSVLADENAYKIIATHRTTERFVLPSSARFDLARSAPTEWVDHILVNTRPTAYDTLSQDFSAVVPGFYTDVEWEGWKLLTRTGAARLGG